MSAIWGGAKLADVLELVGIPKLTSTTPTGGKHVEFVSVDRCKVCIRLSNLMLSFVDHDLLYLLFPAWPQEENGGPYKASIPLSQATTPEADVLLAYEMNGEV